MKITKKSTDRLFFNQYRYSAMIHPSDINLRSSAFRVVENYDTEYRYQRRWDTISFYFNDIEIIDEFCKIPNLFVFNVVERVLDLPPNSILLKNSNFKYRSYFSRQEKDTEDKIRQFFLSQLPEDFSPSPLFNKWIYKDSLDKKPTKMMGRYSNIGILSGFYHYPRPIALEEQMFFDYNNELLVGMLNLISPTAIRKTVDIIVDK